MPSCRTVCLLHGSLLCACKPSAWRMVFGKSVAELEAKAEALRPRLPAPGGASGFAVLPGHGKSRQLTCRLPKTEPDNLVWSLQS
jgi:hypothetical protein